MPAFGTRSQQTDGGDNGTFQHFKWMNPYLDKDVELITKSQRAVTTSYSCLLYTSPSPRDRG